MYWRIRNRQFAIRNSGWLFLVAFLLADATFAESQRPNILFIMSDDHAFQAVSCYGGGLNQTPNIDRIAHEGMRFDRCYVTNSLCGPSRACILTGKYSHKNGFYDNLRGKFDGSQVTFPKLLEQVGYQTAIIGKWHLVTDPTGFDYWEVLPGQGQYYRPDFISATGRRSIPGYVTEIITDEALDWLDHKRDPQRPFALMVQHKAPHRPWEPSPAKLADWNEKKFAEPATLFDDYATRGTAAHKADMRISQMALATDVKIRAKSNPARAFLFKRMDDPGRAAWEKFIDPRWEEFQTAKPQNAERTRWLYQLYLKDYLACVESVDDGVGKLLKYLDDSGLAKNTIVVYTSDQGFYLGEHGWFDKRFMYEESLRTPLVIRWPGVTKPGAVEGRIVSNVDFAETFLDAADVGIPQEMQGHSFVPILKGQAPADWRKSFYYHFYEDNDSDHHVAKHEGVTNGRAKLIHFYTLDEWELYDLEKDPHELVNVYGKPEYAKQQMAMSQELTRLRQELQVPANGD